MRATLSTKTFDPVGSVSFDYEPTTDRALTPRVSVTKTLDGGVVVYDGGLTDADKAPRYTIRNITAAQLESLEYLFNNYTEFVLTTWDGAFHAHRQLFRVDLPNAVLGLQIVERVD